MLKQLTNIDIFFETGSFAQTASYFEDLGSTGSIINVIYDSKQMINILGNMSFQNDKPDVLCKTTDVINSSTDSTLVINNLLYYVHNRATEGTGTTTLTVSLDPKS